VLGKERDCRHCAREREIEREDRHCARERERAGIVLESQSLRLREKGRLL